MLHKLLFPEFGFRKDYPVFRTDEKAVPFFGDLFPGFDTCEEKTEGYFLVCFLSFLMERNMERLLTQEKKTVPVSPEGIRQALLSMQLAQVTVGDTRYWIRTANASLGNTIFKKLKMKIPKNISTDEELATLFALTKKKSWWQLSLFSSFWLSNAMFLSMNSLSDFPSEKKEPGSNLSLSKIVFPL